MSKHIDISRNFVYFRKYTAILECDDGGSVITIEERGNAYDELTYFAIVGEKAIRSTDFNEFLTLIPGLRRIEIPHNIELVWDDSVVKATLTDVYSKHSSGRLLDSITYSARLKVNGRIYATNNCDTLQDAIWELHNQIGDNVQWLLRTCFHCYYSAHARFYSNSDRDYWCYRDVQEFSRWKSVWKSAPPSVRFGGAFYASAFHVCDAWRPDDRYS